MSNQPPEKNHSGKIFLFSFLLIAASIAGMVVTGIMLYENKKSKSSEDVLRAQENLTPSVTENTLSDLVSVALSTRQYTILIQNLAPVVNFEVTDEDCCGDLNVSQVMQNMSVLESAQGPWTFEKEASSERETVMIGTSSNDYLFGYTVDNSNQITKIVVSKPEPQAPPPTPTPTIEPVQGVATVSAQESDSTE